MNRSFFGLLLAAATLGIFSTGASAYTDLDPAHAWIECGYCHGEGWDGTSASNGPVPLATGSVKTLCESCHQPTHAERFTPRLAARAVALDAASGDLEFAVEKHPGHHMVCIVCHSLISTAVIPRSRNIRIGMGLSRLEMCRGCHPGPIYPASDAFPHRYTEFTITDPGFDPAWPSGGHSRLFVSDIANDPEVKTLQVGLSIFTAGDEASWSHPPKKGRLASPGWQVVGTYRHTTDSAITGTFRAQDLWTYAREIVTWDYSGDAITPGRYEISLLPREQEGTQAPVLDGLPFVFEVNIGTEGEPQLEVQERNLVIPPVWGAFAAVDTYQIDADDPDPALTPNRVANLRFRTTARAGDARTRVFNVANGALVFEAAEGPVPPEIWREHPWDGTYTAPAGVKVPPGLYRVQVTAGGAELPGTPQILIAGPDPVASRFTLDRPVIAAGGEDFTAAEVRLVDGRGSPLSGWSIELDPPISGGGDPPFSEAEPGVFTSRLISTGPGVFDLIGTVHTPTSESIPVGVATLSAVSVALEVGDTASEADDLVVLSAVGEEVNELTAMRIRVSPQTRPVPVELTLSDDVGGGAVTFWDGADPATASQIPEGRVTVQPEHSSILVYLKGQTQSEAENDAVVSARLSANARWSEDLTVVGSATASEATFVHLPSGTQAAPGAEGAVLLPLHTVGEWRPISGAVVSVTRNGTVLGDTLGSITGLGEHTVYLRKADGSLRWVRVQVFSADVANAFDLVSRDRMFHARIVVPPAVERVDFSLGQPGSLDLGTFRDLLARDNAVPSPHIYDSEDAILSPSEWSRFDDPEYAAVLDQSVLIIRDPEDATGRTFDVYTVFDSIAPVRFDLTLDGNVATKYRALEAEPWFADWIDTINLFIQWRPEAEGAVVTEDPPEFDLGGVAVVARAAPATRTAPRTVLRTAAAGAYPSDEIVDRAGFDPSRVAHRSGVAAAALDVFKVFKESAQLGASFLNGFCEGFWYGIKDDITGIAQALDLSSWPMRMAELRDLVRWIRDTPRAEVLSAVEDGIRNAMLSFVDSAEAGVPFSTAAEVTDADVKAYITGYVGGYCIEKVAVSLIGAGVVQAGSGLLRAFFTTTSKTALIAQNAVGATQRFTGSVMRHVGAMVHSVDETRQVRLMIKALDEMRVAAEPVSTFLGKRYTAWSDKLAELRKGVNDWAIDGPPILNNLAKINHEFAALATDKLSDAAARGFLKTYTKIFGGNYDEYLSVFRAQRLTPLARRAAVQAALEVFDDDGVLERVKEMSLAALRGHGVYHTGMPLDLDPEVARALASRYKAAARQLLTRDKADAESVFGNAAGWEDAADVHGTIQDASLGLTQIVETPGLGPAKAPALARRLGRGTQGYYNTAGKTLDMPPPPGVSSPDPVPDRGRRKVNDSILSVEMPHVASRYDPDIAAVFGSDGVQEFHGLLHLDPASMTPAQRDKLRDVADRMELRSRGDTLVKVVPSHVAAQFRADPTKKVSGYVARGGDLDGMDTPQKYFENLRLDYDGTPYTMDGKPDGMIVDELFQLEIPPSGIHAEIPRHADLGAGYHDTRADYPNTRTGLLSNRTGRVQPEYHFGAGVEYEIPEGTRLRRVSKTGGKDTAYWEFRGGQWEYIPV